MAELATVLEVESSGVNLQLRSSSYDTELMGGPKFGTVAVDVDAPGSRTFAPSRKVGAIAPSITPVQKVAGVVSAYDQVSVQCDLMLDGREIEVTLPRSIFEDRVHRGYTFYLEMMRSPKGFKQPVVTPRIPDLQKSRANTSEIEKLIAEL